MESKAFKVGGLLALALLAPLSAATRTDRAPQDSGTQRGEYQAAGKPAGSDASFKGGSTAEVGTQPEEYGSAPKKTATKDRVGGTPGTPASVQASQKRPPPPGQSGAKIKGDVPGTQPSGDYKSDGAGNKTSTGRERTGPGAQPGEYKASGKAKVGPYDTVHNVRIRKDTPHPDSGTRIEKRKP